MDDDFYYKLFTALRPRVGYRETVEDGVTILTPYIEWESMSDG